MQRLGRLFPLRRAMPRLPLTMSRRAFSAGGWENGAAGSHERVTYYDYLDRLWNSQWFGAIENLAPMPESSLFSEAFVAGQQALGLEPAIAILLFGACSRFFTFFFSLYGERASERMRNAMLRLKAPHEAFQRVYYREGSSAMDIQLAATALKGERRRVFLEEKTSNMRCLSSLLGSPLVLFGLFLTTSICENPRLDVGTSSFLWCPALTMPDPYGILPLAFCGLTLLNFELSYGKGPKTGWMSNLLWGARLGCLCVLPAAVQVRAGVALYFIGMNLIGLLQPLLLRSSAFRTWFDFPTQQHEGKKNAAGQNDDLHARMCVQFPYLSHLFNPESEENTGLLQRAAATSSNLSHGPFNTAGCAKGDPAHVRKQPPSSTASPGKGSNFAASGWKTTQTVFTEEDFIPEVGGLDKSSGVSKKK